MKVLSLTQEEVDELSRLKEASTEAKKQFAAACDRVSHRYNVSGTFSTDFRHLIVQD